MIILELFKSIEKNYDKYFCTHAHVYIYIMYSEEFVYLRISQ